MPKNLLSKIPTHYYFQYNATCNIHCLFFPLRETLGTRTRGYISHKGVGAIIHWEERLRSKRKKKEGKVKGVEKFMEDLPE